MGSKAREGAKAMSFAFVLLDFQQCRCQNVLDSLFVPKIPPIHCREALLEVLRSKKNNCLKATQRGEKRRRKECRPVHSSAAIICKPVTRPQQALGCYLHTSNKATESFLLLNLAVTYIPVTWPQQAFGCYLHSSNMATVSIWLLLMDQ